MLFDKKPSFKNRDAASSRAWEQGKSDYMKTTGLTMGDIAFARKDLSGNGATLLQQKKVRGAMGSFVTNINEQIGRIEEITNNISRMGVRGLDLPWRELKTRAAGDADEKILEQYAAEISREIAKLASGSSASIAMLPVEEQKKWDRIHDVNLSIPELVKVLKETQHMANIRLSSVDKEIDRTGEMIRGSKVGGAAASQKVAPAPSPTSAEKALSDEDLIGEFGK
jgi:hypothetical protein